MNYVLQVFKKDGRLKQGEKLVKTVSYPNHSGHAMMDEMKYLYQHEYPKSKFRLDFISGKM